MIHRKRLSGKSPRTRYIYLRCSESKYEEAHDSMATPTLQDEASSGKSIFYSQV
jgi:hypothetical protein